MHLYNYPCVKLLNVCFHTILWRYARTQSYVDYVRTCTYLSSICYLTLSFLLYSYRSMLRMHFHGFTNTHLPCDVRETNSSRWNSFVVENNSIKSINCIPVKLSIIGTIYLNKFTIIHANIVVDVKIVFENNKSKMLYIFFEKKWK